MWLLNVRTELRLKRYVIVRTNGVRGQLEAISASSWLVGGILSAAACVVLGTTIVWAMRANDSLSRAVARAARADSSVQRLRGILAVPLAGDTLSQRMLLFKDSTPVDLQKLVAQRGLVVYVATATCPMCRLLDRWLDSSSSNLPLLKVFAGERSRVGMRDGVIRLGPPPAPFLPSVYAVPSVFVLDLNGVVVSVANGDVSRSAFLLGKNASLDFASVQSEIGKLRDSTISSRKSTVAP
jgi:hypothetical protein